jgi:DNA-binding response OmpR family regulator
MVTLEGNEIVLAKKEFELLHLLATKPGRFFFAMKFWIWYGELK